MQKTKGHARARFTPYWLHEILLYMTAEGWRRGAQLTISPVFWSKLGRVARHRLLALTGRVLPLKPVLERLAQRPAFLHLEFANLCNANCIFCPYQFQQRKKQLMTEQVFRKAVDDYVRMGGGPVGLTPIVGDALIHPDFVRWVRHLRSFRCITDIHMTTNGILLDKHEVNEILSCGVTSIIVSTAGFEQAMYKRMYRSDAYQRMRQNVMNLLDANSRRMEPLPIRIALRPDRPLPEVMRDPDLQPILAYKPPLTFHFAFGAAGGRLLDHVDIPERIRVQVKPTPTEACESLYRGPIVLSDGSVSACACSPAPMDAADLRLGHILESNLLDLWTGAQMKSLRASFAAKCRPSACQGCGQYECLDLFRTPSGRRIGRHCPELGAESPFAFPRGIEEPGNGAQL